MSDDISKIDKFFANARDNNTGVTRLIWVIYRRGSTPDWTTIQLVGGYIKNQLSAKEAPLCGACDNEINMRPSIVPGIKTTANDAFAIGRSPGNQTSHIISAICPACSKLDDETIVRKMNRIQFGDDPKFTLDYL